MKKIILLFVLIGLAVAGFIGYEKYNDIFQPNIKPNLESDLLYIAPGETFEETLQDLADNFLIDAKSFQWVADKMKFDQSSLKAGRYRIKEGINNRELVNHLRAGRQEAIKMTIRAVRNIEQLAGLVSEKMYFDSLTFLNYLKETYTPNSGFTSNNVISLFIPNTYEIYWNTSPEAFLKRMGKEHERFWNKDRIQKANNISLSKEEVYTLASIVEKETQFKSERQRMAGVYLNRLKIGMPLQAGPTVIFAWSDFTIRRVLFKHLELDNPYNTYKYAGLPPGPIYMPTIDALDSVLDAEKHDYLYFAAKPNSGGAHSYAKTLAAHNRNARVYHRWANENGIK